VITPKNFDVLDIFADVESSIWVVTETLHSLLSTVEENEWCGNISEMITKSKRAKLLCMELLNQIDCVLGALR